MQAKDEIEEVRESIRRRRPFGTLPWMEATARRLGLEASMRPLGRPRKEAVVEEE